MNASTSLLRSSLLSGLNSNLVSQTFLLETKNDFCRRPALAELSGPGHDEHQHARIGDSSRKIAKTFPRGGICQMGVIEKDHHRLTVCQVGYQRGEACE